MKLRFTLGSIIGLVTTAAGIIVSHDQVINLVTNSLGGKAVALGATILMVAKGVLSFNHDQIPDNKKAEAGPVVFEKTGPLKP